VIPRGSTILAGGIAQAGDTKFMMEATVGDEQYGISSNKYLAAKARTKSYVVRVTIHGETWSYDETTLYDHAIGGEIAHTDRNTLRRA
jgi:hypothetical protein